MKKYLLFLSVLLLARPVEADSFRFLYTPGEKYRILSTVQEDVFINSRFSHRADILNRITVEVLATDQGGGGELFCTFQTSEEARGQRRIFSWGQVYESHFHRDARGRYTIGEEYFMPIVRDVPVFPERDLSPGDSWAAQGEEVHDFRASFGLREAVRFPIDVSYRYEGQERRDGQDFDVFSIGYTVFHSPRFRAPAGGLVPIRISGFSKQRLFWDRLQGRPQAYEEEFTFVFDLSGGDSVEYRGRAQAQVVDADPMDRDLLVREIEKEIRERGIPDTLVVQDELGVSLRLENIQFPPDSAYLSPLERDKLDRIGEILKKYPQRDILVTGHTALAGSQEGRQLLSEERAAAVGSYLLEKGVRPQDRMVYRGLGARAPLADNSTQEGMRKNRRVEITIMEN